MVSSFLSRLTPTDEEFGKKDDDRRTTGSHHLWFSIRRFLRLRGKRLAGLISVVILIWFLFTHRLSDILGVDPRGGVEFPRANERESHEKSERPSSQDFHGQQPNARPPFEPAAKVGSSKSNANTIHYYEGEMNFYKLPISMSSFRRLGGWSIQHQYVLFSAASLKSAAALIPIACDMASRGTSVHMAFMGRNEQKLGEILNVNGVQRDCEVVFHDARPDFALYSTDLRAEESVMNALKYLQRYLRPSALVTHSSLVEDDFFTRAVDTITKEHGTPLIQVPYQQHKIGARPEENLSWISRLDTSSLTNWDTPNVEIVVQITLGSAGKVKRLLESLWEADYAGITPPRLTIELPSEADDSLIRELAKFQWPPGKQPMQRSELNVRRRIPIRSLTAEEASVRFMELFFPIQPDRSHVLVLSPNARVTSSYYQQLRYYMLHLKHSRFSASFPPLMGIGLNLPSHFLNGSASFSAPGLDAMKSGALADASAVHDSARPHFLWQAPNTDAALYFGDAWRELHSFLSLRLAKFHDTRKFEPRQKVVGDHMPAWSEFVLEFMHCRGYSFFYPGSATPDDAAIISTASPNDGPDEFRQSIAKTEDNNHEDLAEDVPSYFVEPFLPPDKMNVDLLAIRQKQSYTSPLAQQPLINTLPFRGFEPSIYDLPQLTWDGNLIAVDDLLSQVDVESNKFRQDIGGCVLGTIPKGKQHKMIAGSARDLFCFGDEVWQDAPHPRRTAGDIELSSEIIAPAGSEAMSIITDFEGQKPSSTAARNVGFADGPVFD